MYDELRLKLGDTLIIHVLHNYFWKLIMVNHAIYLYTKGINHPNKYWVVGEVIGSNTAR